MDTPNRGRALPWLIFSALCFAALAAVVALCLSITTSVDSVKPYPRGQPSEPVVVKVNEEEHFFPAVDWDYWRAMNPDVIAWVSIPDTSIDYALVQAPKSDPTYYLTHDIYRTWNPYGCPYIDADCEGLTSPAVYIFGHHMTAGNPMFADISRYSSPVFAQEHPLIYLQTPDEQLVLAVSAASVVRGTEASRVTDFKDVTQLQSWYEKRFDKADMRLANDASSKQLITLVTCSYNYFSNERTLVYTQPQTERNTL